MTVRNERLTTVAQLLPYHYYQAGEGLNGLVCYIDPLKERLAARYSCWFSQAPRAATASELPTDGSKAGPTYVDGAYGAVVSGRGSPFA